MMRCPATDCEMEIPPDRVMCRPHWFMVPKDIRAEVWSAWQTVLNYGIGLDGGFQAASSRHDQAKAAAIASVNQKLETSR